MVPEVQGVPEVSVLWVQKVRFAGSGSSASDASHCFFGPQVRLLLSRSSR